MPKMDTEVASLVTEPGNQDAGIITGAGLTIDSGFIA